jgi:nitroreductase
MERDQLQPEVEENREADYDIEPLFLNRWSPRAMTGAGLEEEEFMPLFEAARWAPSSYNNQHWRFVYAERTDDEFEDFLELIYDGNAGWAEDAAVLVVLASKTTFDHNGEEARTHSFDTGAAWENLALEGARRGLAVHAMQGFDYEGMADYLDLPEGFELECMVAVGERAPAETLPEDLQERETPSGRKELGEIVSRGNFSFN